MEFLFGGASSMCAVVFTNPLDVLKTRQQLEGELIAKHNLKERAYKGIRQSLITVLRTDGLRGLQKGLPAAILFQFSMNSVRLGTYQTAENLGWTRNPTHPLLNPLLSVFWGGFAGLASATVSCPFYVVKTQLQAVTAGSYTARYQHHHSGTWVAFGNIYRQSGIRGLFRGYPASVARLVVGSAAEMSTFSLCKKFLWRYEVFQESIVLTALASSTVAGFFTSVLMSPCDVVTTRMTNQGVRYSVLYWALLNQSLNFLSLSLGFLYFLGWKSYCWNDRCDSRAAVSATGKGLLYSNIFDCFAKIYRSEGVHGFYKGFFPMYLRVAPHTMLNLTFWELFKGLYERFNKQ